MTITKEDLKKHGFKYFKGLPTHSVSADNIRYYVGFWQKEIPIDGSSETYHVTIEEWDISDAVKTAFVVPFQPWVQFKPADGVAGMEATMLVKKDHTVDDVLAFFEKVRTSMGHLMPANPAPAAA